MCHYARVVEWHTHFPSPHRRRNRFDQQTHGRKRPRGSFSLLIIGEFTVADLAPTYPPVTLCKSGRTALHLCLRQRFTT